MENHREALDAPVDQLQSAIAFADALEGQPNPEALENAGIDHQEPRPRAPKAPARDEFMPSPEQVERAMAKAMRLRFVDESAGQSERARQITEGRKMAAAEGQSPRKRLDERQDQIRAGQSVVRQEGAKSPSAKKRPRNRARKARPAQQGAAA